MIKYILWIITIAIAAINTMILIESIFVGHTLIPLISLIVILIIALILNKYDK